MDAELLKLCEDLTASREVTKKISMFDFVEIEALTALIVANSGQQADLARIKECRQILKQYVSIFSNFRGIVEEVVITKMSLAEDPDAYIQKVLEIYKDLTAHKFFKSEYMVLAAMNIYENVPESDYPAMIAGVNATVEAMKDDHPFLTNSEDMTIAALLCVAGNVDERLEESEKCYNILTERFKLSPDVMQTTSQILALSNKPAEEKCQKFFELYDACKASGHRAWAKSMAIYAAFADLDLPAEQIAAEIGEVDDYLKHQHGFGSVIGCGATLRRLFAASIVLNYHKSDMADAAGLTSAAALAQSIAVAIVITIVLLIIIVSINNSRSNG